MPSPYITPLAFSAVTAGAGVWAPVGAILNPYINGGIIIGLEVSYAVTGVRAGVGLVGVGYGMNVAGGINTVIFQGWETAGEAANYMGFVKFDGPGAGIGGIAIQAVFPAILVMNTVNAGVAISGVVYVAGPS